MFEGRGRVKGEHWYVCRVLRRGERGKNPREAKEEEAEEKRKTNRTSSETRWAANGSLRCERKGREFKRRKRRENIIEMRERKRKRMRHTFRTRVGRRWLQQTKCRLWCLKIQRSDKPQGPSTEDSLQMCDINPPCEVIRQGHRSLTA